jgi:pyridoxamine 5'-phosphate oxidase family protein
LFSEPEINYIKSQRILRIATTSRNGQPDVVPVSFEFDGTYFWVGSASQDMHLRTHRYLNVKDGNSKISLTVDDLESIDPWKPRVVKVYGTAEIVEHNGRLGPGKYLKITPKTSWSYGIKGLEVPQGELRKRTDHSKTSSKT